MDREAMARAFNEWMKDYTDHPEQFEREWLTVSTFFSELNAAQVPSYGEHCAELLIRYAAKDAAA